MNLARCYEPVKKYAEASTLIQHATIHLRETRSVVVSDSDPTNLHWFPLSHSDLDQLGGELSSYGLQLKRDWFAYNGGSIDADNKTYKKPLFFNIALNYVQLDMDRLQERAGKEPVVSLQVPEPSSGKTSEGQPDKKQTVKAKVEEVRSVTPEVQAPARGGLSSLLGGWWGKS